MAVNFRFFHWLLMQLEQKVFQEQHCSVMFLRLIAVDVCKHLTECVHEAFRIDYPDQRRLAMDRKYIYNTII